ncbi:hypothetical protein PVK06_023361 [Gossypium arboreum]|uniref:Uncharacterized protein n=1 Tax=Gossypium arboreum TaxID=29729 RepID=A0ABR0PAY2_GOSAR|nr:hypothetical protein PVK06_023361 [Gossypium arboreum]
MRSPLLILNRFSPFYACIMDGATAVRKKLARESRDCSTSVFQKPLVLSAAEIPLLGFFQVWASLQIGLIGLWAFVYVWAIC